MAISGITKLSGSTCSHFWDYENYDLAVVFKEKFGKHESIIEALNAKLQHLLTVPNRFRDVTGVHENTERILWQLEAQGENVNSQNILIHQILSKFPLKVMLMLRSMGELEQ